MNIKFFKKIYKSMIVQYPPEELYGALNALDNKYKAEMQSIRTCLLNNLINQKRFWHQMKTSIHIQFLREI